MEAAVTARPGYAPYVEVVCVYPSGGHVSGIIHASMRPGPCMSHPGSKAFYVQHDDGSTGVYCEPQLRRRIPLTPINR